jgi:F0F1-type ATP synthase delta subunit
MTTVQVITAIPLTDALREDVRKTVQKKLGSQEKFEMVEEVDPQVLGGIELIINSVAYDATVRRKLNSLRPGKGA